MSDPQGTIRALRDGRAVLVRELHSQDRALVVEGFAHLSDVSRFMRFLAPRKALTEAELDRLTDPTDHDDIAIGARLLDPPGAPVGLARFVRLEPGGQVAEIAITVVDEFHGLGAGTLLLRELATCAHALGVTEFEALIHSDNAAALGFLHHFKMTEDWGSQPETEARIKVSDILNAPGD